jgi:protein gp37
VTCNKDYERAKIVKKVKAPVRFLSIEPLLGEVSFDLRDIDWLIIGAMTGRNPLRPKQEWIEKILSNAKKMGIPIFLKNNLRPYYPISIQEFPL